MTLLLLIDGYNLAQPIAPVRRPDPRWLQRSRESLLRDLCNTMVHGSLCAMGGMTPFPVLSALDHFPQDFGIEAPDRKAA